MDEVVETAAAPAENSVQETASAPTETAEPPIADETDLEGKTVASLDIYQRGSVTVIDILDTHGMHYFVKVAHNQAEIGGTEVWGTGALQV